MGPQRQPVAADPDGLAGDAGGLVGGEEGDQPGDVLRRPEAQLLAGVGRQRVAVLQRGDVGLEEGHRLRHRGGGHRDDGVHGDLRPGQLHRPGAHHADDPGLGRGVVGLAEVADLAGGGADADDPAALALLAQLHRGGAGAGERAAQVGGDDRVELLVGHLPQRGVAQDAGVVDQHVQPAELGDGAVDQRLGGLAGPDGHDLGDGAAPVGGDRVDGGLRDLGVHVVDHDGGAAAGQLLGVGEAEAPAGSGDDGDLAGQLHGFSSVQGVVPGP
ncbi:unannotated protein [freshwater metagenome]|uniref:Unannotated protein n=1 Tax=freshwater metagenome TaxID=449393 RepID=A0A6J7I0C6_9ZZZZ